MSFGGKVSLGIATGLSGALMGNAVVTPVAAGARVVPVQGDYVFYAVGANITLQVLDQAGVWNNVTAAGVGGYMTFDGATVGFFNAAGVAQNVTLQKAG